MVTERIICTIVQDIATKHVLLREGPCEIRFSPFSTFKIPLALMGYDSGILTDANNPVWHFSDERQQKPVDPTIWMRESIVWYSQEMTRALGADRFRHYVDLFDYGNRDVSGDPEKDNGLIRSWLGSSLGISAVEQIRFMGRLMDKDFTVSATAYDMIFAIVPVFHTAAGWTVHGKTGSGWLRDAAREYDIARPQGWFTGWAELGDRRLIFARLEIGNTPSDMLGGWLARDAILAMWDTVC